MSNQPLHKIGSVRVADAREYGHACGFLIEEYSYWGSPEPHWAIPAWEDAGMGHRSGLFATREQAQKALSE